MATATFAVAPFVNFSEVDLTTVVPSEITTIAAIAGVFSWGPVNEIVVCNVENDLVSNFGEPTSNNFETWFTGAGFLAYGAPLNVVRAANTTNATNGFVSAVATTDSNSDLLIQPNTYYSIINHQDYDNKIFSNGNFFIGQGAQYVAKWPGAIGDSLLVSVCDSGEAYSSNINLLNVSHSNVTANAFSANIAANTNIVFSVGSNVATITLANATSFTDTNTTALGKLIASLFVVGDVIIAGNSTIGIQYMQVSAISNVVTGNVGATNTGIATLKLNLTTPYRLSGNYTSTVIPRQWQYASGFAGPPSQSTWMVASGNSAANDQLHAVIVDQDGLFTGVPGTILEPFAFLSRATDAFSDGGASIYYRTVINGNSKYVWNVDDRATAESNTSLNITSSTSVTPLTLQFINGQDGLKESLANFGDIARAYDKFLDPDMVDVSLILTGKSSDNAVLPNYLIDNIARTRKDCVVFLSPPADAVLNNVGNELNSILSYRNNMESTSYAFADNNYKYTYDIYNDVYRWVPLNGDIAGLAASTDSSRAPWWAFSGLNRGILKNVIKLAWQPSRAQQNLLCANQINPVIAISGQGPAVLMGDFTMFNQPSAFNAINVRRLFIVLEKAISTMAKFDLFEFNDVFTRTQFVSIVNPYLASVKGLRGIQDFIVVCDETNNPGSVVDNNQFVADIYIKPARAIRYIQLNFVAVASSVSFKEVVGNFGV